MSRITVRGYEWSEAIGHYLKTKEPSDWLLGFIARRTCLPISNNHVYVATVSVWGYLTIEDLPMTEDKLYADREVILTGSTSYEKAIQILEFAVSDRGTEYVS